MAILGTVSQAGAVLDLFSFQHPEWGVRQVARTLAIPKSNAHQLLSSLESIGLLHRMVTGRYRLGFKILTLGQYLLSNTSWRDVAHRALVKLEAQFSQTVQLAVLDGGCLIYVDKILGSNPQAVMSSHSNIGQAISPHANALGRVLLASKSWRVVLNTFQPSGLHTHTPHTITDQTAFKTELEQIARRGFALDLEESRSGVCCIAAPIRNHNGDIIAAISLSLHSSRNQSISEFLCDQVLETAASISRSIAFDPEFVSENRTQARLAGRN
jgi:IclR family transcriptional regulator, KDG regulon repressor